MPYVQTGWETSLDLKMSFTCSQFGMYKDNSYLE